MNLEIIKLRMNPGNRMVRFGFGQHNGNWFARLDLWSVGWRLVKKRPEKNSALLYVIRRPVERSYIFTVKSVGEALSRVEFIGEHKCWDIVEYMSHSDSEVMVLVVREKSALNETLALFSQTIGKYFDFRFRNPTVVKLEISTREEYDVLIMDDYIAESNLSVLQLVDLPEENSFMRHL